MRIEKVYLSGASGELTSKINEYFKHFKKAKIINIEEIHTNSYTGNQTIRIWFQLPAKK